MKDFFFLVIGLAIILGSIFLFLKQNSTELNETRLIKINDATITVEVVDTDETRRLGLSGRTELKEGTGMLFIFDRPAIYAFWMKDMRFPIDIIWIDENFVVVDIDKEVSPDTFPQSFSPEQAVQYVLELPAGSADKYRIDLGAVLQ